jgi:hypothetical protein
MTAVLTVLKLIWPYVLCAILAGYLTHRVIDVPHYDALQAEYVGYKAQVADADAKAQEAAKDAVEAQIQTRLATEANNGKVIAQLQAERDSAAVDRDFARRLLAAAQAKPATTGDPVSAAIDRPGTDGAAGASSDRSLAQDLGDATGECRAAIQRLAALQAELAPQLSR